MINYKFLKVQLKNTWLILVLFSLASILIFSLDLIGNKSLSPLQYFFAKDNSSSYGGAGTLIFWVFIVTFTMALSFTMAIFLTYKLFIKEIERGYIGSWLTLPMSKSNVYATKLLVIISYIFTFHFVGFMFQEVLFACLMKDFSMKAFMFFLTLNISMFLISLLFFAICLFLISKFQKHIICLTISAVLATLFLIFYLIYIVNWEGSSPFQNFRYLTILIFVQSPLTFDENNPIKIVVNTTEWYQYYPIIIQWGELVWKFIIPIACFIPLFIFSMYFFNKKNLAI